MDRSVIAKIHEILATLRKNDEDVALHEPIFCGNEWAYLKDCLDSSYVSSVGQYVDEFERKLAAFTGAKYAVACSNGTSALQVCLRLAGVREGDEVLVPALTFVATANAVSYLGARAHFVDSEEQTLGIDADKLGAYLETIAEKKGDRWYNRSTGRRLSTLVPVHIFGHSCDLDPLVDLCAKYKMTMVEDACESLGSYYKGRHTGRIGALGALSFNGNKLITTGGGGAVITDNQDLAIAAKSMTTTAKTPHSWEFIHDEIGYNFRMPNLNAALGCAQLEQVPGFLASKRRLAEYYKGAFKDVPGIHLMREPSYGRSNFWLNALVLEGEHKSLRDEILKSNHAERFFTRPLWRPLHLLSMYRDHPRMSDLAVAEDMYKRVINIPSSANLLKS